MIVMVISLKGAYGIDFTFDSPEEIELEEEFVVEINVQTNEVYDIKIFVYKDTKRRNGLVSEIYSDGSWKSSWFYLKGVFPSEREFKNRVLENYGDFEICARMRKTGESNFDEECKDIKIIEKEIEEIPNEEKKEEELKTENLINNKSEGKEELSVKNLAETKKEINKVIVLNKKENMNEGEEVFISKKEKARRGVFYGFFGMLIFLVIFLALRRL
jgi:hypothetical protein